MGLPNPSIHDFQNIFSKLFFSQASHLGNSQIGMKITRIHQISSQCMIKFNPQYYHRWVESQWLKSVNGWIKIAHEETDDAAPRDAGVTAPVR
jgi:hypothetical protein